MTEEGATEEPLTEEIIRDRWESLTVDADFFEGCRKHAINLIFAENYERKIYFFECENIDFQNELGETMVYKWKWTDGPPCTGWCSYQPREVEAWMI